MTTKLKWEGIKELSWAGKEMIEEALDRNGVLVMATERLPRTIMQRIATLNNLSLDYKTVSRGKKQVEHYILRIDHQQRLRRLLKEKRKWSFVRNLTLASVALFLIGLLIQVFSGVK